MRRKFTFLGAAIALFAFLAIPLGMRGQVPVGTTMWAEDFSSYVADDVPSGDITSNTGTTVYNNGTVTYSITNGGGTTKIYDANLAGGESPELLVAKGGGTWTIANIPTGNAVELTLTYKTNNNSNAISSTTEGVTVTEESSKASTTKTYTIQTEGVSAITLVVSNTASGNTRIDDFSVVVRTPYGGTPAPTTYTVTYDCNGGTSDCPENVTGIEAGTAITLASAPTKTDYTFDGWSDGTTIYQAGASYTVNGNVTFTAQWTEIVSGDDHWVLADLADLTASDVFVIVGNNGSNYAMSNNNGTGSAPSAVAVTVAGNEITSSVFSTIKWTISGDATDGYTFYPNGDTEKWLYCTATNNGVRVGTNTANIFNMDATSGYLVHQGTSRFIGIYNSQDWRCYTSAGGNIANQTFAFYKKMDSGTVPPSISAENVSIEYNAVSGAIEYSIYNGVAGGTVTAEVTDGNWLTLGQGTTSPISFTCSANQTGTERTATVTLTYTYNRATATTNVTVTQAGNPNAATNISDITATGTYTVQGTIVAKSQRGFIVGDGTGYVYYYNQNYTQADYNIGDMVKLTGSVVVYGGVFEFNNSATITAATSSSYVAEDPTVLTGEQMDARVASTTPAQLSNYVQYEGTLSVNGTHYNITDIVGATTAIGSISYPLNTEEITALDGKHVKVTGYYVGISSSTYYNTMLGSIKEIASSDPSITAEDVSIEYNATTGAISYTINHPVSGGVLTAATESEWLTLGTVGTTVPFTCTANTTASPRTATVTLTYSYNTDLFVTKTVTVTQAGNPSTINNISDITAAGTYTVQGTIVAINNRGFILGDGTGYVYYYYGATGFEPGDYNVGDKVKLAGSVVVYGGVYEFNNTTVISNVSESNYVTEEPTVLSGADMDARVASTTPPQLSSYVQYEGTLAVSGDYYNITNIEGATTAKGSISFPLNVDEITALDGKQVKVTGYYVGISSGKYYNTMLGSIEEVVITTPTIIVTPAYVELPDAEETDDELTVTYHNITNIVASVVFYAADGETTATYDWITATINSDNNVYYTIEANEGEARTAYLKVKVGNVYSNLVTITQPKLVLDYATLPFEFDGGRADIATTNGLSHNGLDSDYGASPKLKFNNTGDWLLLHFVDAPGILTFDTKGNGSSTDPWAGTFIVQTSVDGETYTDLASYTDLTSTLQSEEFELDANVRYIKWVYTEKVLGNVALGNIAVSEAQSNGQVLALESGWNWCSANVNFTLNDLKAALVDALPGATSIQIKTKDYYTKYNGRNWRGSAGFNSLDLTQMFKIELASGMSCELTLAGDPIDPSTIVINISNGSNWISYPLNVTMQIADAFAGFAVKNDQVKSKDGYTTKIGTGNAWRGTISTLDPGQGYIYKSVDTATKPFTFTAPSKSAPKNENNK
jgi:uncharacterized repeat protein (TIGR02543 family)